MALIIPPGFALGAHRHTITGDPEEMIVTMGYDVSSPDVAISQQDLANRLHTAYANAMKESLTPQTTVVGLTLYFGQDGGDPVVVASNNAPVVGTSSGSALPPSVAVLVRKVTALGGRQGRGRMFIPGFNEAGVDPSGALVGANLTQLQTDLNQWMGFLNGPGGEGVDPVLLHSTGETVTAPTVISSFSAQPKVATQRRRLR